MKKILGILGISLIMTFSFFNMSSVVDSNQNVDLASIIQNANADSEGGWGYDEEVETNYTQHEPVNIYLGNGRWFTCTKIFTNHVVECYGTGDIDCTPVNEEVDEQGDCPEHF